MHDQDEFAARCKVCGAYQFRALGWLKTSPLLRCGMCSSLVKVDGDLTMVTARLADEAGDPDARLKKRRQG